MLTHRFSASQEVEMLDESDDLENEYSGVDLDYDIDVNDEVSDIYFVFSLDGLCMMRNNVVV